MEFDKAITVLEKDPKMRKIISDVGQCKIRVIRNKYEALVEAIITQQISDAAGKVIAKRFRDLFGKFPRPIDVINMSNSDLCSSGISRMKSEYIKDISDKIESKQLNFRQIEQKNDEDVISELTKIRGVGRWTAEMFLIFGLGRMDILPLGDLGLRRGIQTMYSMSEEPDDETILRIAKKWVPYRTVATWYIWRGVKNFNNI
ncbi:MAG: DNA-3-methyladenine glycosylase 2 family protein [Nitrosopumilus sp.]|nr:DNA-3-methyladenine glycosylase 2 family protein [Nitrosopumilus sp.]